MACPLKLPAHTATVNARVVPTAQLSVKCRLVPVFTATGNGKSNGVLVPNQPPVCVRCYVRGRDPQPARIQAVGDATGAP